MMKRRTDPLMSPQKLFEEALFSPLNWPGKMVHLERNSLHEYRQRVLSANLSVAELYHENSKFYSHMLPELILSLREADEVRNEFIRRRCSATQAMSAAGLNFDRYWREVLTTVAKTIPQTLFYAVELLVIVNGVLAFYEPVSDTLYVVKQLSAGELDILRRAIRLMAPPEVPPHHGPLLFILGCFARNEVLLGPRGYRRTLLEAGQVTQAVLSEARQRGLAIWPVYEFADWEVDMRMENDGIEEGTLIAFELQGATSVR